MSALPANGDSANPGFPVGIQLHTVPNALGTYACDSHQGNTWRKVNMWFHWNGVTYGAGARQSSSTDTSGSSCSITVTKVSPNFEGSFNATFVSGATTITVTEGLFRLQ